MQGAFSLKQGTGENVARFRVCLSQQAQILQTEYPSRIQQTHVEEVKWDHFYEGLSPVYWQMLANKVSAENPVTYSKLLLAAQKLERWAEARHTQFPKSTTAGSSNVTCSHSQENLFPSRKWKGSHISTAWFAVIEDHETEEDSGPKTQREKRRLSPLLRGIWEC